MKKGYKKTVCPDGKYFHQNKLFFIFTLIIFSEHSYFLRKSQITPERKQRKKIFFNSICTPLEHPDSPQNLYLWAFSQFSPLLKLNNNVLAAAVFVCFIHVFIIYIIYIIYGFSGSQNFRYNFGTHHSVCPLPNFSRYKAAASS